MARTIAFMICSGLGLFAGARRTAQWRCRPGDPAMWALQFSSYSAGTAYLIATEPAYRWIDRIVGVPNVATLVVYSLILVFSLTITSALLVWTCPPSLAMQRVRWHFAAFGGVLMVMALLFSAADARDEHPIDFDAYYGTDPTIAFFLLIYLGAFGYALTNASVLIWRLARLPGAPWRRRGLRCAAVGSAVALGYCVSKGAYVMAARFGNRPEALNDIGVSCAVTGALLISMISLSAWGPMLTRANRWLGRWRAYHQLFPLWHAVMTRFPALALKPPRGRLSDLVNVRQLDFRLLRRYIEIRDGLMQLRPYYTSSSASSAAPDPACEAARIKAALQSRTPTTDAEPVSLVAPPADGEDLASEVRWLTRVAKEFARPMGERR